MIGQAEFTGNGSNPMCIPAQLVSPASKADRKEWLDAIDFELERKAGRDS
jgi:hypothetical protein